MRHLIHTLALAIALVGGCSKSAPPEGTPLLERTRLAVDAVCACGADQACRTAAVAKYEAIVAEVGSTAVGAEVVDGLAAQAERVAQCTR